MMPFRRFRERRSRDRRSGRDRRGGKDRRKHIDPRYRSPDFPEFVDRRKSERRQPVYDEVAPFVREHPIKKWVFVVGVLLAALLVYICCFTNLFLNRKSSRERDRKGTITIGCQIDGPSTGRGLDLAQDKSESGTSA